MAEHVKNEISDGFIAIIVDFWRSVNKDIDGIYEFQRSNDIAVQAFYPEDG